MRARLITIALGLALIASQIGFVTAPASAAPLPPVTVDCPQALDATVYGSPGDTVQVTVIGPCAFTRAGSAAVGTWTDGSASNPLTTAGTATWTFTLATDGTMVLTDESNPNVPVSLTLVVTDLGMFSCVAGPSEGKAVTGSVGDTFTVFLFGGCTVSSSAPGVLSWATDVNPNSPTSVSNQIVTVTLAAAGTATWTASNGSNILTVNTNAGGSGPAPDPQRSSEPVATTPEMRLGVAQRAGTCPAGWTKGGWEAWAQAPVCLLVSTFEAGRWSAGTYAEAMAALHAWRQSASG